MTIMRFGLDWFYADLNSVGSKHGFNGQSDPASLYNFLTTQAGFCSVLSMTYYTPPSHTLEWQQVKARMKGLLDAANNDSSGQRCKIIIKLQNWYMDQTIYGAMKDVLNLIGPPQDNPALLGFLFRGLSLSPLKIGTGNPCPSVNDGAEYADSSKVYGIPTTQAQYDAQWTPIKALVNSFGYGLGWSGGAGVVEKYVPRTYVVSSGNAFVNVTSISNKEDVLQSYNNYYNTLRIAPNFYLGTVGGMWDYIWFVPTDIYPTTDAIGTGFARFNCTHAKFEEAFRGFTNGIAANPYLSSRTNDWLLMFYGYPPLFDEHQIGNSTNFPLAYNANGLHVYLDWWKDMCSRYGFYTGWDTPPDPVAITPITPPVVTPSFYVPQLKITGNESLPIPDTWTQTHPVIANTGTFKIDTWVTNLNDSTLNIYMPVIIKTWDYDLCEMVDFATGVTDDTGHYIINPPSPSLPNTGRNQAWFIPDCMGAKGIAEDLPILASTEPPECTGTGQSCIGYNLYQCVDGHLQLIEENSVTCGYEQHQEGDTMCEGTALYTYTSGEWVLTDGQSESCGYIPPPPPPNNNTALILAGLAGLVILGKRRRGKR